MPIKTACKCGHRFNAPSKFAGKKVKCPACKEPLVVPSAEEGAAPAKAKSSGGKRIPVTCECGKTVQAKPEYVGKKVKCPGCGKPLLIQKPAAGAATAAKAAATAAAAKPAAAPAANPLDSLFEEVGLADVETGGNKCPGCKSPMKADAILCIQCGYNTNLGRKMEVERPVTAEDRAKNAQKYASASPAQQKKAKKKRGGGNSDGPNVLVMCTGVTGVVWLAAIAMNFAVPAMAPQVVMIAWVVTSLVNMGMSLWILSIAFSDSAVQGLLCLLVPFYMLIYIIMHWNETSLPFLTSLAVSAVSILGLVLFVATAAAQMAAG